MNTTMPPTNFVPRNWEAPEYERIEPYNRFEIFDGPTVGGIETNWQPQWGVLIDLPETGNGDGLDLSVDQAKQLRDDLTAVLNQLEQ